MGGDVHSVEPVWPWSSPAFGLIASGSSRSPWWRAEIGFS